MYTFGVILTFISFVLIPVAVIVLLLYRVIPLLEFVSASSVFRVCATLGIILFFLGFICIMIDGGADAYNNFISTTVNTVRGWFS